MNDNKTMKIVPTMDLAFKKCLGSVENTDILAGLIEDFFGFRPEKITISNPYNIAEYWSLCEKLEKASAGGQPALEERAALLHTITDIKADLETSKLIAEMQNKRLDIYWARSIYYLFTRFCEDYDKSGGKYEDLRPMYALNILKEPLFKHDDAAVKCFELFDPDLGIRMDKEYVKIVYFELERTTGFRNPRQALWQKFFMGLELPGDAPDYIKKAERVIDFSNLEKEEREVQSALEKYVADQEAYIRTARDEGKADGLAEGIDIGKAEGIGIGKAEGLAEGIDIGKAEGIGIGKDEGKAEGLAEGIDIGKAEGIDIGKAEGLAEGEAKARLEIARIMKAEGVDKAFIAKFSGLTLEEIDAL